MTLTLDEVRKTKFHMARRNGYEVSEVDLFVDRVEASFAQLSEENRVLKEQVESLQQGGNGQNRRGSGSDESAGKTAKGATAAVTKGEEKLVVTTSAEASPAVVRLVQMATEQSEQLVAEADAEAKRKVEAADQRAAQITNDAKTKADKLAADAKTKADKLDADSKARADKLAADAKTKADKLDADSKARADKLAADSKSRAEDLDRQTTARRTELVSALESERDQLRSSVRELRGFESAYRNNLTAHLREQIESIERGVFEPKQKPGLLNSGNANSATKNEGGSSTPRLDALLGDNKG